MFISVFDIFKIGIGPSSSHTVGPMKAACKFVDFLETNYSLLKINKINIELYGSLSQTGLGHGTDKALLMGLEGQLPHKADPNILEKRLAEIFKTKKIRLNGKNEISFSLEKNITFHTDQVLPFHSNGMKFFAFDEANQLLVSKTYYSVGGGFLVEETNDSEETNDKEKSEKKENQNSFRPEVRKTPPYPFTSAKELLKHCEDSGLSIPTLMLENEYTFMEKSDIRKNLLEIWQVMEECIHRGCQKEGVLPGRLKVKRRAPSLYRKLNSLPLDMNDPFVQMDWVNLYAIAVNEENASGGKVVTAPTNGAAGIIPAILYFILSQKNKNSSFQTYQAFQSFPAFQTNADSPESKDSKENKQNIVIRFLLTAAAIGILYKEKASISGAEVGCQGEVGVACSMAAGALAEIWGGSPEQVENAAEIGMEHNLGLTCDPVDGLVQIPCIERNAMGAIKAINAARLALRGDGKHKVSLDKVIYTMKQTGDDMKTQYKETAQGGLAVNIIEC